MTKIRRFRRHVDGFWELAIVSIIVAVGLIGWLAMLSGRRAGMESIRVYGSAGLQAPLRELLQRFTADRNVECLTVFKGSGELVSLIQTAQQADLFVSADSFYIDQVDQLGLVDQRNVIAVQRPCLVVLRSSDSMGIQSLDQLAGQTVRVSLAKPELTAIGRLMVDHFSDSQSNRRRWQRIYDNAIVTRDNVIEVANDVVTGAADAGIVWNATAHQIPRLRVIEIPELAGIESPVEVCRLTTSSDPDLASELIQMLSDDIAASAVWARFGYLPRKSR
jgi:molybdenum ABC transporter molybdate-binding protein